MQNEKTRFLALGGLLGPMIFIITVVICSSLRPGYDHVVQFISELGARGTPNALLFNLLGFVPMGLGVLGLGAALLMYLPRRPLPLIGAICIVLFGIGGLVVSVVSCEPGCPPEGTTAAVVHDAVSGLAFLLVILAMGFLGLAFRSLADWQVLWRYSVLSCLLALPFFIAIPLTLEAHTHTGLWQRIVLLIVFTWCARVGWHLFKVSGGTN